MKKDNWFLEDRKFKWYDIVFPIIFGVLTLGMLGIILLGQSL